MSKHSKLKIIKKVSERQELIIKDCAKKERNKYQDEQKKLCNNDETLAKMSKQINALIRKFNRYGYKHYKDVFNDTTRIASFTKSYIYDWDTSHIDKWEKQKLDKLESLQLEAEIAVLKEGTEGDKEFEKIIKAIKNI